MKDITKYKVDYPERGTPEELTAAAKPRFARFVRKDVAGMALSEAKQPLGLHHFHLYSILGLSIGTVIPKQVRHLSQEMLHIITVSGDLVLLIHVVRT